VIIHSKRLIFVHIQKTGGNSVGSALNENADCAEKHFLARDLCERYGADVWEGYFKFAFVRNPWDRLVSWWSMMNAHREAYANGAAFNKFQSFVIPRATTFEAFLENCDEEIIDTDGGKWIYRDQLDYLTDASGRLIVDFVGRFERLQKNFELVTQRVLGKPLRLPQTNKSLHRHYSEYYSPALVEKVSLRFKRDIEMFGYVFGQ
jgi:chondroitin 4-sulfotransferase 11